MSYIHKLQSKHNLILKVIFVALISLLFARLIPTEQVSFYKADEFDAVWSHNDLVINEDVYVEKSKQEFELEKQKISLSSALVFNENLTEKAEKLELLKSFNLSIYNQVLPILDTIYSRGIIQSIENDKINEILVSSGNEAKYASYSNYFTLDEALSYWNKEVSRINPDLKESITIENYLAITFIYDQFKTESLRSSLEANVSLYNDFFTKGQCIIKQGEVLTKSKRDLIKRYNNLKINNTKVTNSQLIGRFVIFLILNITLLLYLFFFRKNVFGQNIQVLFLYLNIIGAFMLCFLFFKYGLMQNAIPFVLIPILVRVFFDSRTALFTHLIAVLMCSFFMADKIEFLILQLITGIGILFFISEMRKRQQIMSSALIAIFYYCTLFLFYNLGFGTKELVTKFSAYLPYLISGGLVLLATPLIFIAEKTFSFVSDFKLLELCDLNQPLLRELSTEIPGTFQHSLQVANLAEEAIYYIGGNTLLIRAGAMYHDVGKIANPTYFIENQSNNVNPHLEMLPKESARIIINHVIKGIELAKRHKLPEQIIDFIRTHHGTTTVGFFLNMEKKELRNLSIDEDDFKYPGPIPFSKETAVLMLADGVEAASRSLKTHDAIIINDLVDKVIDYKIAQNQLINADITFKDITTIKKIFKKRLMNIYHARIEYPS